MNAEQRFRQVLEDIGTCMNGGTATRCEWLTILTWIMDDAQKALDEFPEPEAETPDAMHARIVTETADAIAKSSTQRGVEVCDCIGIDEVSVGTCLLCGKRMPQKGDV